MDYLHEATEKGIRDRAAQNGLNPDEAVAVGLRGAWVQHLWRRLQETIVETEADQRAVERVQYSKLRYSPTMTFAATTVGSRGRYAVSVNLGIVEAIAECARIVAAATDDPSISGHSSPDGVAEAAGLRLAHVLGWLTSVARYPIATAGHDLPPGGQDWARGVTMGAILFVLAHELAHVIAGDVDQTAHERELRADLKALEILRLTAARQMSSSEANSSADLLHLDFPTDLTVPSGVLFLSFEGLRQRAMASAMRQANLPTPPDIFQATQRADHPSPYERLVLLREAADRTDPDGSEVASVDAILNGFDALLPAVHRNMPEWVLDETELKQWLLDQGEDPAQVPEGFYTTFEEIYLTNVVGILREASLRGHILATELAKLSDLAGRMPRTVINALALARTGQLLPLSDKDARGIHAMGQAVAQQIHPLILRSAVRADPTSIARMILPNPL